MIQVCGLVQVRNTIRESSIMLLYEGEGTRDRETPSPIQLVGWDVQVHHAEREREGHIKVHGWKRVQWPSKEEGQCSKTLEGDPNNEFPIFVIYLPLLQIFRKRILFSRTWNLWTRWWWSVKTVGNKWEVGGQVLTTLSIEDNSGKYPFFSIS